MDIGDWVFWGVVAISGIASIAKGTRKKAAEETSMPQSTVHQEQPTAEDWIKTIIRQSTGGLLDDDDFIPKKNSEPQGTQKQQPASRPTSEYKSRPAETVKPRTNAEQYRRTNQSLEVESRAHVSLENTPREARKTGLRASEVVSATDSVSTNRLLNPAEDLRDMDEVKKAIIYGEILQTKF